MRHYTNTSEYTGQQYTIVIDPSFDNNLTPEARKTLKAANYLLPHEESPQEAFARASIAYASDQEHAQRLYDYVSKCWFMFATPVLGSAGNPRGAPISCYLLNVSDSRESIADSWTETMWLSTEGGGVGQDWSQVRSVGTATSRGTYTPGVIPFLKAVDSITLASIQGGHRRGATAIYLDVSHPEIEEFIVSRNPQGGDQSRKLMNIHTAVNIPDAFMEAVMADSTWDLVDPHTKQVKNALSARALWLKILETRMQRGEPYLHFTDTSNRHLPQPLKDKGLRIHGSNLCVAPETLVKTSSGDIPIKLLCDQKVRVWNGEEFSEVIVRKTGQDVPVITIFFSCGSRIRCTPYHKFYLHDGTVVEARDLLAGHELEPFESPELIGCPQKVYVVDVVDAGETSDTYCFTEPKRNRGMFNGILTGNCNEIFLPTSEDRTAVCCLSSVNLEYFDAWFKNDKFIGDLVEMLDNVLDVFLKKAPDVLHKAKNSARSERSIGLGAMGFHLYLQKNGIPFEGVMASSANRRIFNHIKTAALSHSQTLAAFRGEAPDMRGTGLRNAHLLAIAPNASSSDLCGSSPGIEPFQANIVVRKTGSGAFVVKNKALDKLLVSKYDKSDPKELEAVWDSILRNDGSVQHLDFLDPLDKDVFKTAFELDQSWIVEHASVRQMFICQGQSVNLFLRPGAPASLVHKLHKDAWQKGLKGLYYLRSKNEGKAFDTKKSVDNPPASVVSPLVDLDTSDAGCLSCEG